MSVENSDGATFNKLKGEQVALLCKALEAAISEEETLEQLMLFSLDELLSNIPKAKTYRALILNVVKWAESKGKIRQLIIAASLENPGNALLQQFVKSCLHVILDLSPLSLTDNTLLASLIQELTGIRDFTGIVLSACSQTLPDLEISSPKLRKQLLNNEISYEVKWLILLELFLITWEHNAKGTLYIVLFVQNLKFLATGEAQARLTQWLNNLPESIRPVSQVLEQKIYPERPSNEALKRLQAYFLITVDPLVTSEPDRYGVNAYLVTRLGNEDRYTKIENMPLQLEPDYTFKQIEDNLPDWMIKVNESIGNRGIEIQIDYRLELPPVAELTVEFWLPFNHLSTPAETWKIYEQPTLLKRRNLALGEKYRVTIRSYDRFIDPDAFNNLNRTWQKWTNLSAVPNTHHLDCWNHWESLRQQLQDSCLSLSLTCPVCVEEYQQQREKLFAWILTEGIPLVLWSRAVELTDEQMAALKQRMQTMLTADIINQLEQLLEQVKQARTNTNDKLALWCDEPKRLIELKKFREKGRLRA
jgi:vWA-MoxR associated protein C-terminal domain/Effector-associated domain 1